MNLPSQIKNKNYRCRKKIEIKCIEKEESRQIRFSKRRQGLFKKANELSTLCGAEVAVVVFSLAGKPYFFGQPSVDHVLGRFLNVVPNPSDMLLSAQSVQKYFWWDIDLHSMGFDDLREYEKILQEQQIVVTQAAQRCYFQALEVTMEHIEAMPHTYPAVGEDDYFLCLQQDYDCTDIDQI